MSTIVVVRKDSQVTIASDTLFSQGSIKVSPSNKVNHHKIHPFKDCYLGFTGWAVFHNIFEDILERHPGEIDLRSRKHIFNTFQKLHRILQKEYFIETHEKTDQPVESSQWDCLIATPNGIYAVGSYREVIEYGRYWADGSGMRIALGAMHATYDLLETSEAIASAAVVAACELDDGSALPVQKFSLPLKPNRTVR